MSDRERGRSSRTRCGYVAVVGKPNVGKSTLVNHLVGERISIATKKAHTTRQVVRGILTRGDSQAIFLDTPGQGLRPRNQLQRTMQRAARGAAHDADLILHVVAGLGWSAEDDRLAKQLKATGSPVILVINKVDQVRPKEKLLPFLEARHASGLFEEIVPCSALNGSNVERLVEVILGSLPVGEFHFPASSATDQTLRARASELVREALTRRLHQELPHGLGVEIEYLDLTEPKGLVHATLWVARAQHKAMVIGKGGHVLKASGEQARKSLSELFQQPVHLQLWVKVREKWVDDAAMVDRLGHGAG